MDWTNQDNHDFYEQNVSTLQTWAQQGGLSTCPDLKILHDYIEPAHNLLEVGAGFGRVIEYLHAHYPQKNITAIEKSNALFQVLQKKMPRTVNILHSDMTTVNFQQHFDLILWLWSGLTDFSATEQPRIIQKIQPWLTEHGTFVIETFPHNATPANGALTANQHYELAANNQSLQGYLPSPEEITCYAHKANLYLEEIRYYKTSSHRERVLYILRRVTDTHTAT